MCIFFIFCSNFPIEFGIKNGAELRNSHTRIERYFRNPINLFYKSIFPLPRLTLIMWLQLSFISGHLFYLPANGGKIETNQNNKMSQMRVNDEKRDMQKKLRNKLCT